MQSRETLKRHAGLVDRMAQAQGLDIEEQMLRGNLSMTELEDAVLRCTGCDQPCTCESWLASRSAPVDVPPEYCRNTEMFADLRKAAR
ncbi:DUF6455 family protein [Tropicibacter oceani]|uniref:DUF6455 family protein n=1 Tax=Tropicibacter oceani TaxID=3058420 RepID=A0ABY8QKH3_9RHOB|nr:DUF6455 family protein [Tropicibacter oceani]WGW05119.1 DUF6455 family protein [Tropicibacter oceani]